MATLPKNTRAVQWKNKDGSSILKYQTRIQRTKPNGQKVIYSELFDTLEEAILYKEKIILGQYPDEKENTTIDREMIDEQGQKIFVPANYSLLQYKELLKEAEEQSKARKEKDRDEYKNPKLGYLIDIFVSKFVDTKPELTQKDRRYKLSLKIFYDTIKNTEIEDKHTPLSFIASKLSHNKTLNLNTNIAYPKKKVADFTISQFGRAEINDYIDTRLRATTKKGTPLTKASVSQEVSKFSVFYRALQNGEILKQLEGIENVILKYDHRKLKNANKKRRFVIPEEWITKLFEELQQHRNREIYNVVMLSYFTAMRRSEIIYLKWSQIFLNVDNPYIDLKNNKSDRPRIIYLTKQAHDILNNIQKKTDKEPNSEYVFRFDIAGFEGSFTKIKERLGMKILRFHDLRRQAIRNMILLLAKRTSNIDNSVLLAEIMGFNSARRLQENHIEPLKRESNNGIQSQEQALQQIGHSNVDETQGYFNLKGDLLL